MIHNLSAPEGGLSGMCHGKSTPAAHLSSHGAGPMRRISLAMKTQPTRTPAYSGYTAAPAASVLGSAGTIRIHPRRLYSGDSGMPAAVGRGAGLHHLERKD